MANDLLVFCEVVQQ